MTKDSQTPQQGQDLQPLIHHAFQPLHPRNATSIQMVLPTNTNNGSRNFMNVPSSALGGRCLQRHQQNPEAQREFLMSVIDDALALVEDSEDDFFEDAFSQ